MFFTQDNQTLYLDSWEFNAALILEELAQIIENNGGTIKAKDRSGYIVNRSIIECQRKAQEHAERVREAIEKHIVDADEKRVAYLAKMDSDARELKSVKNEPVKVSHLSYISFVLGGIYYYFQIDSNPFFEHYFVKTPVVDGCRASKDACLEEINTEWIFDSFFKACAPAEIAEDRREAANMIFNQLLAANCSKKAIDSRRVRVSNTYNSGYHYETIKSKERFEALDWLNIEKGA